MFYFLKRPNHALLGFVFLVVFYHSIHAQETELSRSKINLIPYPKEVKLKGEDFHLTNDITIGLDADGSEADKFSGEMLQKCLHDEWNVKAAIRKGRTTGKSIILSRSRVLDKKLTDEGYQLSVDSHTVTIRAAGEAGLFYGVQSLLQLFQKGENEAYVKGMEITDWPDTRVRAVHYDTKHHQDSIAYVEGFIRDLAKYKVNMLVWEWEDKFAYPSHPEIAAPGAFTMQQMQQLTGYAKKFHIQLTPLVQGLGHVSYILKWPQYAHLREVPASNFEFCPLKDQSYDLLFDLWDDAVKATPGSQYIHIGSDETYELGLCPQCAAQAKEIGKSGLYHLFTSRSAKHLQKQGRKVMIWERPMGWNMSEDKGTGNIVPEHGIVLTESYGYETPDFKYARDAKALGYPVFAYDPNPGVEPLFLPYFFRKPRDFSTETIVGCLGNSYDFLTTNLGKGVYDGVIRTSWDDAGLHNQMWMLSFVTTAAYSWNASKPSLPEFTSSYFRNYYGDAVQNMERLFFLLNDGALFYMESFERHVWHNKSIGKTRIPDLPRGDAMEYNPFWNKEYASQITRSQEMLLKMDEAMQICASNIDRPIRNKYDFEIYQTIIDLIKHNAQTYLDLGALENAVAEAHRQHILNSELAFSNLQKAEAIVRGQIERREKVFNALVSVWEKTRLPKGVSTNAKKYFFEQDRTVHFANRAPDMTYLIIDEQRLDLEGYLLNLQKYEKFYHDRFLKEK